MKNSLHPIFIPTNTVKHLYNQFTEQYPFAEKTIYVFFHFHIILSEEDLYNLLKKKISTETIKEIKNHLSSVH